MLSHCSMELTYLGSIIVMDDYSYFNEDSANTVIDSCLLKGELGGSPQPVSSNLLLWTVFIPGYGRRISGSNSHEKGRRCSGDIRIEYSGVRVFILRWRIVR